MFFLDKKRELTPVDFKISGMPERYINSSIEGIPDSLEHKKYIKKYLDEFKDFATEGVSLLLYGELGNGKTSIASLILKEAISYGCSCHFATAKDVANASGYGGYKMRYDNGIKEISLLERFNKVDFLLIDDLGAEEPNEKTKSAIEDLVRNRYNRYKPTIITTNLKPKNEDKKGDSIESVYGKPLLDVFKECLIPIVVKGHSFRKVKSDEILLYLKN